MIWIDKGNPSKCGFESTLEVFPFVEVFLVNFQSTYECLKQFETFLGGYNFIFGCIYIWWKSDADLATDTGDWKSPVAVLRRLNYLFISFIGYYNK